jgi:hypothetical protein
MVGGNGEGDGGNEVSKENKGREQGDQREREGNEPVC